MAASPFEDRHGNKLVLYDEEEYVMNFVDVVVKEEPTIYDVLAVSLHAIQQWEANKVEVNGHLIEAITLDQTRGVASCLWPCDYIKVDGEFRQLSEVIKSKVG